MTAEEKSSFLKGILVRLKRSHSFFENHGCLIELGERICVATVLGEAILGLDGVAISSDAFFPFRDSIDHATRSGQLATLCLWLWWQHSAEVGREVRGPTWWFSGRCRGD